jgi:hypothetical protein
MSSCSYEEFDYSNINKIDNLIVESRFSVELIDSLYEKYAANDYLDGMRDIVHRLNKGKDTRSTLYYNAHEEDDETFKITSVCFSHYFNDYYLMKSWIDANEDNRLIIIGRYSTYLKVDVERSAFSTMDHFIPIALSKDTNSRNIWIRICLSKYLFLHQYYEMSLDYLLEAEQINPQNLYVKELIIRNYLAMNITNNMNEYVKDIPNNYTFLNLNNEDVKLLNSLFPDKKFKSDPVY